MENHSFLWKCASRCSERRLQRSWSLSRTEKLAWEKEQEQDQEQEQEQESEQDLFL